jgi:hypothetical protein
MPMAVTHKFSLGETVVFSPGSARALALPARGKITRLLPKEGTEYQYHIQFGPTGEQRMARKSQLRFIVGASLGLG